MHHDSFSKSNRIEEKGNFKATGFPWQIINIYVLWDGIVMQNILFPTISASAQKYVFYKHYSCFRKKW
jgi:hypothetical protein